MKKIFMSVTTMIVTRFIMRVVDRIKNPPVFTREELRKEYEKAERYRKKLEADRMRRAEPKVNVMFESTPRSPDAWLSNIGTVGEMAADDFQNLIDMSDEEFNALPPSPNTGLVKSWREMMRAKKHDPGTEN